MTIVFKPYLGAYLYMNSLISKDIKPVKSEMFLLQFIFASIEAILYWYLHAEYYQDPVTLEPP